MLAMLTFSPELSICHEKYMYSHSSQLTLLIVMCSTDTINIVIIWLHTFSLLLNLAKLTNNDFLLDAAYMWSVIASQYPYRSNASKGSGDFLPTH